MTIYDIFRYTKEEILEVENLLEQVKRFDIEDKVQESFFQFSPRLLSEEKKIEGFGEHEPWSVFHKKQIKTDIIVYFIENNFSSEYLQDELISEHIWKEKFDSFINIDFINFTNEELNLKFIEFIKLNSEIYKKHLDEGLLD